jgi:hypothetical protein
LRRAGVHSGPGWLTIHGRSRDAGCAGSIAAYSEAGAVRRVKVSVAALVAGGCRFLRAGGELTPPRRCRKRLFLRAHGSRHWHLAIHTSLPPGDYRVVALGTDFNGNHEHAGRHNRVLFTVG